MHPCWHRRPTWARPAQLEHGTIARWPGEEREGGEIFHSRSLHHPRGLVIFVCVQRPSATPRDGEAGDGLVMGCFAPCGDTLLTRNPIRFDSAGRTHSCARIPHLAVPTTYFPCVIVPVQSTAVQYWIPTSRVCPGMPTSARRKTTKPNYLTNQPAPSLPWVRYLLLPVGLLTRSRPALLLRRAVHQLAAHRRDARPVPGGRWRAGQTSWMGWATLSLVSVLARVDRCGFGAFGAYWCAERVFGSARWVVWGLFIGICMCGDWI